MCVSDNLNKLVENKNTIDVFMSFYMKEEFIHELGLQISVDIWQML